MKRALEDLAGITIKEKYRLESLVGEGGMAYVYRGVHLDFNHPIAFKVLFSNFASKEDIRERFKREATLQFRLQHPNIVRVIDMIEEDGLLGIVLDWVEGSDLEVFLQNIQRPATLLEIRRLFVPILQAVGYAHDQQIVHRDLKPSNVLLSGKPGRESPKVMDFGIAKSLGDDNFKTRTGLMVGTPYYISPEQAQGMKSVDHRTDIYSLGVTLFQMLTGRVPFEGKNALEVVAKHCFTEMPSLLSLRPDLPPAFEDIIRQAMAKDPAMRFRSARAFARMLDELLPTYEEPVLSQDEILAVDDSLDLTALGSPPVPSGWRSPGSTELSHPSEQEPQAHPGLPSATEVIPPGLGLTTPAPASELPLADSGITLLSPAQLSLSAPGLDLPLPSGEQLDGYTSQPPRDLYGSMSQPSEASQAGYVSQFSAQPEAAHLERDVTPPYARPLPNDITAPPFSISTESVEYHEPTVFEGRVPYSSSEYTVPEVQTVQRPPRPAQTIWMFLTIGLVSGLAIFTLLTWLQGARNTTPANPAGNQPPTNQSLARLPVPQRRMLLHQTPPRASLVALRRQVAPRETRPAPVRPLSRAPAKRVVMRSADIREKPRSVRTQRKHRNKRSRYVGRLPSRPPQVTWRSCKRCVFRQWEKLQDDALLAQRNMTCNRSDFLAIGQHCARRCGYYYYNFCKAIMLQSGSKCSMWIGAASLLRSRAFRAYRRTISPAVIQRCRD